MLICRVSVTVGKEYWRLTLRPDPPAILIICSISDKEFKVAFQLHVWDKKAHLVYTHHSSVERTVVLFT